MAKIVCNLLYKLRVKTTFSVKCAIICSVRVLINGRWLQFDYRWRFSSPQKKTAAYIVLLGALDRPINLHLSLVCKFWSFFIPIGSALLGVTKSKKLSGPWLMPSLPYLVSLWARRGELKSMEKKRNAAQGNPGCSVVIQICQKKTMR